MEKPKVCKDIEGQGGMKSRVAVIGLLKAKQIALEKMNDEVMFITMRSDLQAQIRVLRWVANLNLNDPEYNLPKNQINSKAGKEA